MIESGSIGPKYTHAVTLGPLLAMDLQDMAGRAQSAADLALNRRDVNVNDEYVDPEIERQAYAEGVEDVLRYLLGAAATDNLRLVLRAGRSEEDT